MTIVIEEYHDRISNTFRCLLYNLEESDTCVFKDVRKENLFNAMFEITTSTTDVVRFVL